jgi:hypothetical protein
MTPKEILDVISTGGALAVAGLVIVGFLFGWLHTRNEMRDKDAQIAYERTQKEQALAIVKNALELLAEFRRDQRERNRKP